MSEDHVATLPWGPYQLEGEVERLLAQPGPDWRPTGYDRDHYLDLAELVVGPAAAWLDEHGCLIDPYEGRHPATCTARFVGAVAGLLGAGRRRELLPAAIKAFDWCVADLREHRRPAPVTVGGDFYTKELGFAFAMLAPLVGERVAVRWRWQLAECSPEKIYTDLLLPDRSEIHNFNIYALSGEGWRIRHGLVEAGAALAFIDDYLPRQFGYVTDLGMYRDPNDPLTYDLSVRQNLTMLLASGYRGRWLGAVDELLRRGGLTTLLYTSPDGLAPYGGRSNQFHHMEGMIACVAEWEARRHAQSNPAVAGAFKRLARQAAAATERWLAMTPFRQLKNGFDPVTNHGCDPYGQYSVYALLAASLFGMAHYLADDGIDEAPTPAEVGGGVLVLKDAFHKVFASCGGHQVEIDTRADLHYDATGLGRYVRAGCSPELGLSMPLCGRPSWLNAVSRSGLYAGIGPVWKLRGSTEWSSLAEVSDEIADCAVEVLEQSVTRVAVRVVWTGSLPDARLVTIEAALTAEGLELIGEVDLTGRGTVALAVPLFLSDGARLATIVDLPDGFEVRDGTHVYRVRGVSPALRCYRLPSDYERCQARGVNRNGVYHLGLLEPVEPASRVALTATIG